MRYYNLVSGVIVLLACILFYITYEKKEGSIRRMVLLAVMTALAVVGRCLFMAFPSFKPVTAIVILSGIYMGSQSGFLVGSLAALISNIFFGQGPWTPFQMFAWGSIGMIAGIPGLRNGLKNRFNIVVFGVYAGVYYALIMDIWTVLSMDATWNWKRYLAAIATGIPQMIAFVVSNVVFLLLTIKPIGEKLERIQVKHGIFCMDKVKER